MAGNPLAAGSIATFMASSIPKGPDTQMRTTYDAIALLCHSAMIAVGFKLVGLGEEHRIEAQSEASEPRPLPPEWNASDTYAFRYSHAQSSLQYLIKVNRLGSKAVVFGLGIGDEKTTSFDVAVNEYLSPNSFPFALPDPTAFSEDASPGDRESALKSLQQSITTLFLTPGRVADLGALIKIHIIQKLMPGIHKLGYESSAAAAPSAPSRVQDAPVPAPSGGPAAPPPAPHPLRDPLAIYPPPAAWPFPAGDFPPPGFEDEHQILRRPGHDLPGPGARNPLSIGHDDLYPPGLGPHDPLRGSFTGGVGGGGMHPTFGDPLFQGGRPGQGQGDARAPPGARYDPVGPGDEPYGGLGGPGPGFPGGREGGGGRGGFGGGGFGGDII